MQVGDLTSYGLPSFGVSALNARGINDLLPIQKRAVEQGLLSGTNLLAMAPTSSGKTLIAELAALQHAATRKGAVFLTSHKALAYEKYAMFRDSYESDERLVRVTVATGDEVTDESAADGVSITVATYEKWYYMLVDKPKRLEAKSLVIVDELQTLGDQYRGSIIEALLTWTLAKAPDAQILGLSATVPNIEEIATWLDAKVISVSNRSVPLVEEAWSRAGIVRRDRDHCTSPETVDDSPQPTGTRQVLEQLAEDDGLPAVVFCVTKKDAQGLAIQEAQSRKRRPECEELVSELDEAIESNPVTRSLRDLLPKGLAFHTADLDLSERRLIEAAYREQKLDLLFATPTLSAGVNLPIKTVVFDNCYRSWISEYISATEYLNMAGRAGRRGMQEQGRSVLIARDAAEFHRYESYLAIDPDPVVSHLGGDDLERIVLQAVAGGMARRQEEIVQFFNRSYHAATMNDSDRIDDNDINHCLTSLVDCGMIVEANGVLIATRLGLRVASSGILPQTGQFLFSHLESASGVFEWDYRDTHEKAVLLVATGSPDLAPLTRPDGLLYVYPQQDLSIACLPTPLITLP